VGIVVIGVLLDINLTILSMIDSFISCKDDNKWQGGLRDVITLTLKVERVCSWFYFPCGVAWFSFPGFSCVLFTFNVNRKGR
jgi:hypothetical protein|tara:strand:+ start:601 stop:846 length:246 start_codon:yes stop_codon:yes gene_type:complete